MFSLQFTVFSVQRLMFSVKHGVDSVQFAARCVHCEVTFDSFQGALSSVLCSVSCLVLSV